MDKIKALKIGALVCGLIATILGAWLMLAYSSPQFQHLKKTYQNCIDLQGAASVSGGISFNKSVNNNCQDEVNAIVEYLNGRGIPTLQSNPSNIK
jgi:hypothetical protein